MRKQKHRHGITKGWTARLTDGSLVSEHDGTVWSAVKDNVVWLGIEDDGAPLISLPGGQKRYLQGKTGSCGLLGGQVNIESRWVGFETESGAIVKIRMMEDNGRIEVETS